MLSPLDTFSKEQKLALAKCLESGALARQDGELFTSLTPAQVFSLAVVADQLRQNQCGADVSYVINRNINFTNVCIKSCRFCAFSRDHRDQEGYFLNTEQILERVAQAEKFGATEICVQAGLPPKMEGSFYLELTRAIKTRFPHLHLHAFSPEEVLYGAIRSKCSTKEYLFELKNAGLDTLPGTSAEILEQNLRDQLAPGRITVRQWKEVIEEAHQLGFKTTSTMMFGHLENEADWLDHMFFLREIQERTGGFTEFVPLGFVAQEAPLSFEKERKLGPDGFQVIQVHALARLILGRDFRNIQASWVKEGEKMTQLLLASGCNDVGGTLINESISTSAGAKHGQLLSPKDLRHLITRAGRNPIQRNTVYQTLKRFDGTAPEQAEPLWDNLDNPESTFGSYQALTRSEENRFVHPNQRPKAHLS